MKLVVWSSLVVLVAWSNRLLAQPLSIPQGVLVESGLNADFIAKFALFIGSLLICTVVIGKLLKWVCSLPLIAGQIIAGMVLGPSCINIAAFGYFSEPIKLLDRATGQLYALASSDLFLFFVLLLSSSFTVSYLLWIAGHETNIKDLLKVGLVASSAGILGALMPIVVTVLVAVLFLGSDFNVLRSTGLGIVFAATSVSIPVAMLFSQNKMHLRSSKATLGAAIIDDVVAIVLLSLFFIAIDMGVFGNVIGLASAGGHARLVKSLAYLLATFFLLLLAGFFFIRPLIMWLQEKKLSHLISPIANGLMFLYFALAELLGGLAGITGAYFAGLFHRMGDVRHHAEKTISPFVNSVLLPLFLCSIGLQVDIKLLTRSQWVIVLILLSLAIFSKLIGCFMATQLSDWIYRKKDDYIRWNFLESYVFGASMVARGEVGLVVSTILNGARIITPEQYVMAVITIVLTTIASPIMLGIGFCYQESHRAAEMAPISLNLGVFDVIGTAHLFNIILGRIESLLGFETKVHFSEGRKIVTIRDYDVKIILCPDLGILFEGNKDNVNTIMNMVKESVQKELERCTVS